MMERVGFIGAGLMGGAIAARMIERGVDVLAYDTSPEMLIKMKAHGAGIAASVREVVDQAEIVYACLPTPEVCRAVALGRDGVADGKKVKVYVETSTIGGAVAVELAEALAGRGIALIDAPVVGGTVALTAGTLGVVASGPGPAFERARPSLETFSGRVFYLGDKAGMGQAGKVVNNAVGYAAFLATCEAVAVAMKAGIDMETAIAIINQGSGANFFSQFVFPQFILKGKYEGTGAIEVGVKDVALFLEEAKRLDVSTPMASSVSALQKRIAASGPAGRDTMTVMHFFTDLVGLPRQG
ncbi:3-hydroxyisobutyrate dehydrogenase [Acidocella aquatica]|uniref:3-hydroxyisobutyrate dehydrogenase n=1 Tax=Acidocella aquatica TaxID=1922313 RepID=A0ABQ6A6Z0_9PROT|nr:NAD(P)-dependent oxidoreductase [Acidocella aquatica]GLR67032.1 3-hydroxyisobutyrate dehydrogenase [Acidocella aquatica]